VSSRVQRPRDRPRVPANARRARDQRRTRRSSRTREPLISHRTPRCRRPRIGGARIAPPRRSRFLSEHVSPRSTESLTCRRPNCIREPRPGGRQKTASSACDRWASAPSAPTGRIEQVGTLTRGGSSPARQSCKSRGEAPRAKNHQDRRPFLPGGVVSDSKPMFPFEHEHDPAIRAEPAITLGAPVESGCSANR
jgi:hypothetical protein